MKKLYENPRNAKRAIYAEAIIILCLCAVLAGAGLFVLYRRSNVPPPPRIQTRRSHV